jgi:hypothetical protein
MSSWTTKKMLLMKATKHDNKNPVAGWKAGRKSIIGRRNQSTWQDRYNRVLALVAGVILISCTGCQSDTFTCSKFRERSTRLSTIELLPPQIKTGMTATPWASVGQLSAPLPEEKKIRAELPDLVAAEFHKRGFAVKASAPEAFLPDSTNHVGNARMGGILTAAYGSVDLKAVRPEAKVLIDHVQADGLVFLSVFAYKSTNGRKAWVALGNILALSGGGTGQWTPFSEAKVQIVLVDGETGDVLWRTMHDFTDLEKTRPDQVVAELFKKYPQR